MIKLVLIAALLLSSFGEAVVLHYTVIEFYSACLIPKASSTANTNRTRLSQRSRNFLNRTSSFIDRKILKILFKNNNMHRKIVDVCFDSELLTKEVTDILLDPIYTYQNHVSLNDNPPTTTTNKKQRIVLAFGAYISSSMFKLLEQIVSFTPISVLVYSRDINLQKDHLYHQQISPLSNIVDGVVDNISRFQWNEITVIYLKNRAGEVDEVLYQNILDKQQQQQRGKSSVRLCIRAIIVSPESIDSIMRQLTQNNNNQAVIVLGTWKSMKRTFNEQVLSHHNFTAKSRIVFYLLDHSVFSLVFPKGAVIVQSIHMQRMHLRQHWVWNDLKSFNLDLNEYTAIVNSYFQMKSGVTNTRFSRANLLAYLQTSNEEILTVRPPKGETTTFCSAVNCQPGFHRTFGLLEENASVWDLETGYMCKPCPTNHYKATVGNRACAKCPGFYVSDKRRTKCTDPFHDAYLSVFTSVTGTCCILLVLFGSLLSLASFLVFVVKRQTPIVKISDAPVSFVQLALIFLTFPAGYFLYFEKPTAVKCASRPLLVAIVYNINISIILVKSHKLVMVFSAKTRVNSNEVLKVKLTQIFTVVINLLVTASIFTIFTFSRGLPKPTIELDFINNMRLISCTGGTQITLIISFLICVQLACVFQAYRCRRLPDYLSETMSILYASFITTVFYAVSFPIYFLRRSQQDGEVVQLVVVLVNSFVILALMYIKKVYVILFKSHLNTAHYFKKKRLAASFHPH